MPLGGIGYASGMKQSSPKQKKFGKSSGIKTGRLKMKAMSGIRK